MIAGCVLVAAVTSKNAIELESISGFGKCSLIYKLKCLVLYRMLN